MLAKGKLHNAWSQRNSRAFNLEGYDRSVHKPEQPGVEELRGERYLCV